MFLNRAGTLDIYQVDWRLPELQDHEMLQLLTEHFRSQYLGVQLREEEYQRYGFILTNTTACKRLVLNDVIYQAEARLSFDQERYRIDDIKVCREGIIQRDGIEEANTGGSEPSHLTAHIQQLSYDDFQKMMFSSKIEGKFICMYPNGLWVGLYRSQKGRQELIKKKDELSVRLEMSGQRQRLRGLELESALRETAASGTDPAQLEAIASLDIKELNDLLLQNPFCSSDTKAWIVRSEASTEGQLDRIADRTESVATEHLLTKEEQALLDNTRTPPMAKEKIQKKETLYDRVIRGLQD